MKVVLNGSDNSHALTSRCSARIFAFRFRPILNDFCFSIRHMPYQKGKTTSMESKGGRTNRLTTWPWLDCSSQEKMVDSSFATTTASSSGIYTRSYRQIRLEWAYGMGQSKEIFGTAHYCIVQESVRVQPLEVNAGRSQSGSGVG